MEKSPSPDQGPSSSEYFKFMVQKIHEEKIALRKSEQRAARRDALAYAAQTLSAPEDQRRFLANAFGILAATDKPTAFIAYETLRDAKVLPPTDLRRELDLPLVGQVFPKNTPR